LAFLFWRDFAILAAADLGTEFVVFPFFDACHGGNTPGYPGRFGIDKK